jgi:NhaP-type Na+/H+ or K+/H+ antiporter
MVNTFNFSFNIIISISSGHGVVNLFIVMVNFVVLSLPQPMVSLLENKYIPLNFLFLIMIYLCRYVWVMFMPRRMKKSRQIISVEQHMKSILQLNVSKHVLIYINHLRWARLFSLVHLRPK